MDNLYLLVIGLVAGVLGGMFGIGGGLVIVPALVFFLKMKQFDALGTSLAALIPPVGLLGAMEYYRNDHMNLRFAILIAVGLFVGFFFGAKITLGMSPLTAKRIYAVFLIVGGDAHAVVGQVAAQAGGSSSTEVAENSTTVQCSGRCVS